MKIIGLSVALAAFVTLCVDFYRRDKIGKDRRCSLILIVLSLLMINLPGISQLPQEISKLPRDFLMIAARSGSVPVVEALLDAGIDIHDGDDAALRVAAEAGKKELVVFLLQHGADIHAMNDNALRGAAVHGQTEMVRALLASGADTHDWGDLVVQAAIKNGHTETAQVLREALQKKIQ